MNKIIRFFPSLIWMAIIFYFSCRQTTGIGGDSYWLRFGILKSFHLIEYAILAIFLYFALKRKNLVILIGYLYGVSDELHQRFTFGRTSRFRDTLFDLAGVLIGVYLFQKLLKIKFFKRIYLAKTK